MSLGYALMIGALVAIAVYLLLRADLLDHVFGLIVLGHAANLLVFGAGRLRRGAAPVLGHDHDLTDPLPQAFVLTAIVIGFGIVAYAIVLVMRLRHSHESDEPEEDLDD